MSSRWLEPFKATNAKRIALYLEDRQSFLEALTAAWSLGKQVVLPGDVLPHTLDALAPHVDAYAGDFPNSLQPGSSTGAKLTYDSFDRELEGVVVFTSGSTGAPTLITKKLRQLFDEVVTLESTFGQDLGVDATHVSTVSHQHIYGLLFAVLWPYVSGRPLAARRLEYPEEIEQALRSGPSVLISSPAHLKRLPEGRRWSTQVQAVFSSGGPLSPDGAARAIEVLGHSPKEIFGSSETGGVAWREANDLPWLPMRGVNVRGARGEGEGAILEVESPHLAQPGFFRTADRVEIAPDNSFRLLGRADRIAKIEEKRVSLELIEKTCVESGLLKSARVVTLDGARVTLGLVGVPAKQLDRKELIDQLRAALEKAVERVAIPRKWRFVDQLPVDAQGKVTAPLLALLFEDETAKKPLRPEVEWLERTPTHASLSMTISPELKVLEGHFPDQPIVPGVAQLDWAISFGRDQFTMPRNLLKVEVLKFQKLMQPGHAVALTLDWNVEKTTLTFKFTPRSSEGTYSSGRVVFAA
ncbi:MAG: acyl-CoA synthetase [Archangium sp.]|nr:acyl-CoA synthetase [Archangium sp.]